MQKYKIVDWMGNECVTPLTFDTFEDAWSAIYEFIGDLPDPEFDLEAGEYSVLQIERKN